MMIVPAEALSAFEDAVMTTMSLVAKARDTETGSHLIRTRHYINVASRTLAAISRRPSGLSPKSIGLICKAASLHDVGKVGVPDNILLKPGKLDADEWEIMKKHTVFGKNMIVSTRQTMQAPGVFLKMALVIAYYHHEKWDGSGYPEGLQEAAIPLPAKLMALADVYDALTTARPYKEAFPHKTAVEIIREGRGSHFDPELVDIFLRNDVREKFKAISQRFAD